MLRLSVLDQSVAIKGRPHGESIRDTLAMAELCEALGVPRPQPAGSGYEFEHPVKVVSRDGKESTNFIDLFKEGCFVLEAKDMEVGGSDDARLRRAFGQALSYANAVPGNPLVVTLPGANAALGPISIEKYDSSQKPTGEPLKRGTQVQIPDPNNPGKKIYFKVP